MAGFIDLGKKIKAKLFGKQKLSSEQNAVIHKTLQDIIFDQCRENVNPDYVAIQAEAMRNKKINQYLDADKDVYADMTATTDFDMIFVDAKAKELGDKVRDKLSRTLSPYFPQKDFATEFDGHFRGYIKAMVEEAYRQRTEVDFGQVCDKITRLVQNSNYFENKFIDSAKTGSFVDMSDKEMTAEEFTKAREKGIDPKEMALLPAEAMDVLSRQTAIEEQKASALRAEADGKALEHQSLTNQKTSLLKERKDIRNQLKAMPDNEALLSALEDSKLKEQEFVQTIRDAKQVAEESARHADYVSAIVGRDMAEYGPKFEAMQKHMEAQMMASGEMHS